MAEKNETSVIYKNVRTKDKDCNTQEIPTELMKFSQPRNEIKMNQLEAQNRKLRDKNTRQTQP